MYYVYKTTNIVNNKIYVGVHKSDNIQSDQYIGSGDKLRLSIAKYGRQKFNRQILYQFQTKEEAYAMERLIVDKQFVKRKDTYNIRLGGQGGFGHMLGVTAGTIVVKDQNGNTMRVSLDDPRYKSGQLKHITKGLIVVKNTQGKMFSVTRDDVRLKTGELKTVASERIVVKTKEGIVFHTKKDDPRYLSGQLVGVNKGIKMPKNHQKGSKNSQYGTMWITNGIQNKKIKKEQNIPQGWKKGRLILF